MISDKLFYEAQGKDIAYLKKAVECLPNNCFRTENGFLSEEDLVVRYLPKDMTVVCPKSRVAKAINLPRDAIVDFDEGASISFRYKNFRYELQKEPILQSLLPLGL